MMIKSNYIKVFKCLLLSFFILEMALPLFSQKTSRTYGVFGGADFYSTYFEKYQELDTREQIGLNYRMGFITGQMNDSVVANTRVGFYVVYRSFHISFKPDHLDPNYTGYLTQVNPKYWIAAIPFSINWKLYRGNDYFLKANTGIALEVSYFRTETTEFSTGESTNSYKLIEDTDWRTGIPITLAIGTEINITGNLRLGIYPTFSFYLKKFVESTEAGYASTYGINLFLTTIPIK